jgi:opacity protein-like surface antigen
MMYKQVLIFAAAIAYGAGMIAPAAAQGSVQAASTGSGSDAGFYGGIALRQNAQSTSGVNLGQLNSAWAKFVAPLADETGSRTLVFGGYRWHNDLAVEAAFGTAETYALTPLGRRGVGLSLAGAGNGDATATRSWNADVYTSWSFRRSLALYGRLGYVQAEAAPGFAIVASPPGDPRRMRDGMNYGVGLRYDVTPALGLRLEYARFGRFAGETIGGLMPESNQMQFGMQFRF